MWRLIMLCVIQIATCVDQGCRNPSKPLSGMSAPGDLRIGGVLPIHVDKIYPEINFKEEPRPAQCIQFRFENYQGIQAIRFAVEEINRNPSILPNITLGFEIYDSCTVLQRAIAGAMQVLSGHGQPLPNFKCRQEEPLAAIIGHSMSTYSMLLAHILGLYRYPQLLHYMKNVRLQMNSGREVFFDINGDPPAGYDIINWQYDQDGRIRQVKVGSYDTGVDHGNIFTVNTNSLQWGTGDREVPLSACSQSCPPGFRKASIPGKPICCFQCILCPPGEISNQTDSLDCFKCPWDTWPNLQRNICTSKSREFLSYEDPLGATLAATGISSSLFPVAIYILFIHYKDTPIVRANNYSLSCLLLISLSMCFLCSLIFIGKPEPLKCFLRQVTFGIVFALCVSCILAKTIMVVLAFKATMPGSSLKKWTKPLVSYCIVICCVIIQTFLCILWVLLSAPFPENNINTKIGTIVIECNEGSPVAFWVMLGYLGLLATISFIVAFFARRLPDSFNEAKFITFSMLAFLSVWVSYIPATLSARGMYTVAMEVFAILSSSWALVICMFVPKCFIILFRPHMNSKEHLMGKERSVSTNVKHL
uniref:G-protein coupled receptors family 3 profile domain-containing protein n=1 Tax=Leptobrachium leishanense TaxID=445787 RepID=A0A8C5W8J6_9ANUR